MELKQCVCVDLKDARQLDPEVVLKPAINKPEVKPEVPTEVNLVETKPSVPSETKPVESASETKTGVSAQPKPEQPVSTLPAEEIQVKPEETSETKSTETKPAKPFESKPDVAPENENKPVDSTGVSTETKSKEPVEIKPVAPAETETTAESIHETKTEVEIETKPASPVETKPAEQPVVDVVVNPVEDKPVVDDVKDETFLGFNLHAPIQDPLLPEPPQDPKVGTGFNPTDRKRRQSGSEQADPENHPGSIGQQSALSSESEVSGDQGSGKPVTIPAVITGSQPGFVQQQQVQQQQVQQGGNPDVEVAGEQESGRPVTIPGSVNKRQTSHPQAFGQRQSAVPIEQQPETSFHEFGERQDSASPIDFPGDLEIQDDVNTPFPEEPAGQQVQSQAQSQDEKDAEFLTSVNLGFTQVGVGGPNKRRRQGYSPDSLSDIRQVSISQTFEEQLFCAKVFLAAFFYLEFGFVIFCRKNIGTKAACKLLVKLTTGRGRSGWN